MMRAFGLAMIALGTVGLGLSVMDWRSISTSPTEDEAAPGVAVVDQEIGDEIQENGEGSTDQGPEPTTATDDATQQASADDTDVGDLTDAALENVRMNVQPLEATGTSKVAKLSPANVRVFETAGQTNETEPLLWAEISAASEIVSEDSGHANFLVTLSEPAERSVVIIFSTINLTANDPEDYLSQRGTVTFEPGVVSAEIHTPLVDDDIKEADEQFAIVLNGAPGIVSFKSRRVTTTIKDND